MTRQKKDSGAPKRPLSAYILFCKDHRDEIKNKNPSFKVTDITKELGERWKSITEKDKKKYEKMAGEDKTRYTEAMKSYTPPEKTEEKPAKKSRGKSSEEKEDKPKRAPSAYIIFCSEMRSTVKDEYPDLGPKDITKKLGELWRELDDDSKADYSSKSKNLSTQLKSTQPAQSSKKSKSESEEKPKKSTSTKKATKKPVVVRNEDTDESELEDE